MTSVFVPWNTSGVFIYGTVGVNAFAYAPFAVLNDMVPLIALLYAFTGIAIPKINPSNQEVAGKGTFHSS